MQNEPVETSDFSKISRGNTGRVRLIPLHSETRKQDFTGRLFLLQRQYVAARVAGAVVVRRRFAYRRSPRSPVLHFVVRSQVAAGFLTNRYYFHFGRLPFFFFLFRNNNVLGA